MNKQKTDDYKKIVERLSNANWHRFGKTFLEVAVESESVEIVKDLLKLGVDVNLVNSDGETVLFNRNISFEMTQFLLKERLNPKVRNNSGNIAFGQHYENDEIIKLLLPVSNLTDDDINLHNIIHNVKSLGAMEEVLKYVNDVNGVSFLQDSETILMTAARMPNNLDLILLLAKSGVDLNHRNEKNQDFFDLCFKKVQKVIRKEFPEFIKLREDVKNYNL